MEEEVKNIILGVAGESETFTLKYGWFNFKLGIKPLTAKTIIEISAEMSHLKEVDDSKYLFLALMDSATDLTVLAKIIAIATGTKFRKIVTHAILKLPLKDIQTLINIVVKQSDMSVFFYTLTSLKGLKSLTKTRQAEQ